MTKPFMDLSFTFAIDLFRVKRAAESRGDKVSLSSLEKAYPELFTDEFQEFIDSVQVVTEYLDQKLGENFSSMFNAEKTNSVRKLN